MRPYIFLGSLVIPYTLATTCFGQHTKEMLFYFSAPIIIVEGKEDARQQSEETTAKEKYWRK